MSNEISKEELSYNEKVELFKELIFGKVANDDFELGKRVSHKEKSILPKEKLVVSTNKVEQSSSDCLFLILLDTFFSYYLKR